MDPNEFDLSKFREDFEQTYEPEANDPEPEDEDLDTEEEELDEVEPEGDEPSDEDSEHLEDEEDLEESDEEEDELPEFAQTQKKQKKQSKEDNAAFAEMRRQNEQLSQQAKVVEQLAAQYGMSVDQFQAEYERLQEEAAAKQQGIPVDILRKMNQQEAALQKIQNESATEKFWGQVDKVKGKYGLEDTEVESVFRYIGERGLIDPATKLPIIEFEVAYKAANFDKIQERKIKEANQKRLADKKKRQTSSAKPHNSNVSATPSDDIMTDQQVEERLRAKGFI